MSLARCVMMVAAAATAAIPVPALAACAVCGCSISTTSLNFGTYNPTSTAATDATATVTTTCISAIFLMIGTIDIGLTSGGSGVATQRTLANGTSRLNYNVYEDSLHSKIWGGLGSGGLLETLTISGVLMYTSNLTAYGSIPARQWVKPGVYSDTVTVTVTF